MFIAGQKETAPNREFFSYPQLDFCKICYNLYIGKITKIGIIAGEIWHLLDKKGKVTIREIIDNIDSHKEIVLMSIGWLAREGHVILEGETPNHVVSLRKK